MNMMSESQGESIPGELSITSDALCDVIWETVQSSVHAEGRTLLLIDKHLQRLLDLQYAQLTGFKHDPD